MIRLYADGACRGNPGPGGWGALLLAGGVEREMYGAEWDTTNNKMELTAAIRGLEQTPPGSRVAIHCDSEYVVRGMTEWIAGWIRNQWRKADKKPVLNQELWKSLYAIASAREVEWHWVRGHAGHPENERCDRLANRGIDELLATR